MPTFLLGAMALVAGFCLSIQSAVNTNLTRGLGSPILAAVVSFTVGATMLWIAAFATRQSWPSIENIRAVPPYAFVVGGMLGSLYMFGNTFLAPRLGIAVTMSVIIAGQLMAAVVLDHFGFFGVALREATAGRLAGVVVMVIGVVMIRFL